MINIYTVKDTASNTTNDPFFAPTDRDAIEGLKQVANDDKTNIGKYPQDFELYRLGNYNPRNMSFDISENANLLTRADELVTKKL